MTAKKNKNTAARAGARTATIVRNTTETRIELEMTIEGSGRYRSPPAFAFSITCWSCLHGMARSI